MTTGRRWGRRRRRRRRRIRATLPRCRPLHVLGARAA
jgi:hypothetical protein